MKIDTTLGVTLTKDRYYLGWDEDRYYCCVTLNEVRCHFGWDEERYHCW